MNYYLAALCLISCSLTCSAKGSENCDSIDFCSVVADVETNYAGFPTMVNDENRAAYEEMKRHLFAQVMQEKRDGSDAASEYVAWFKDHHLFTPFSDQYYPAIDYSGIDYNPQFVAQKVDNDTYLLRVPSFSWDEKNISLIKDGVSNYLDSGCENLIIDLRGNSGGADWAFEPLLNLVYTHPFVTDGVEIRATRDIADHLRRAYVENGNRPAWAPAVADSIDTGRHEFVTVPGFDREIKLDTVYNHPRTVAVIVDGLTVSSAEQFIIFCRQCSDKTTVYGRDNTTGAIDFGNLRHFNMPCSGLTVNVPTSRSTRLARGEKIDGIGIEPDVRIELPLPSTLADNVDEWVLFVAEKMR
ncbi:MAG: S41 family peptidase [Bacteroides sp.]|nr:S41 family peptidase [Bacteroides sp.]MCM1457985.1 S41 family peptidase [Lachnoclostridium sp.]